MAETEVFRYYRRKGEGGRWKRVNVKDKLIGLLGHKGKINQDNNLKHFTNTSKGKGNNLRQAVNEAQLQVSK